MKSIKLAIAGVFAAGTATAGNIAYVAPDVITMEEPAHMAGSGAWLIPLVIVAVLLLALTSTESNLDD